MVEQESRSEPTKRFRMSGRTITKADRHIDYWDWDTRCASHAWRGR